MSRFALALVAGLFAATAAHAQDSAVTSAADAFGERVGIEQLGLYDESQVRGFSLESSGAYRINEAYFARASPLNDPVLTGVGVRVGVKAASLVLPSPSGVVTYRLREPEPKNVLRVGGGLRDYGTQTLTADWSWSTPGDRFGLAGGVVWRPEVNWAAGSSGRAVDLGTVGRWRLDERQTVRAFATIYRRAYDGDYGLVAAEAALPPPARRFHQYSPEWAKVRVQNINAGVLYAGRFGAWAVDLAAFRSIYDTKRDDFTLIEADADGDAFATHFMDPPKTNVSDSAEARVSRVFRRGNTSHLVGVSLRARRSEVDLATSLITPLGAFPLSGDTPQGVEPVWTGLRGRDTVRQATASLNYGFLWGDRLQLRLGAHRTRYEKQVEPPGGAASERVDETTLWNASVVWSATPRASLFASWVTGLEETGFAPQTATNRNEVLPPVEARQYELGLRYAVTGRLTFIGALFDVGKPTTGLRPDGSFGLVGEVAHRGVEGSLAGQLDDRTTVVLGAVAFRPEQTGPLVDAGLVGKRPAGISEVVANASVERELGAGWSVDGQVGWYGERWVDPANTFRAPAVTQLSIGARRRFTLGGRPVLLRLRASQLLNQEGYWATPSTLLWPIEPPTARALLTVTFGG